jgi:hypothetical protein
MRLRDDEPEQPAPEKQQEPPPPTPRDPDVDPGVVIIEPWPPISTPPEEPPLG